nr:MAG TPA: hypothetical protein [Caudoviricetes sp.]
MLLIHASFSADFRHGARITIYNVSFNILLAIERNAKVPIRVRHRIVDIERKRTNKQAVIRIRAKTGEAGKILPFYISK